MSVIARTVLCLFVLAMPSIAAADSAIRLAQSDQLIQMFGNMIVEAQRHQAGQKWTSEPELRRYCAERALEKKRINIGSLVARGLGPDDPRVTPLIQECDRFDPSKLQSNVSCTLQEADGSPISSFCTQVFVRADLDTGRVSPLEARAAVDLFFRGIPIKVIGIENDAGRRARIAQQQARQRGARVSQIQTEFERLSRSSSAPVRSLAERLLDQSRSLEKSAQHSQTIVGRYEQSLARLEQLAAADRSWQRELQEIDALSKVVQSRIDNSTPSYLRQKAEGALASHKSVSETMQPRFAFAENPKVASEEPIGRIGPSYECDNASQPMERLVCSDPELARLELEMVQPFYTLRHLKDTDLNEVRGTAKENTKETASKCKIASASRSGEFTKRTTACVASQFKAHRKEWQTELDGKPKTALEEARRPIEAHLRAQALLKKLGHLPANEQIDGVYGLATRSAISSFQTTAGLSADGLMSDTTFDSLKAKGSADVAFSVPEIQVPANEPNNKAQIRQIAEQYRVLIAALDDAQQNLLLSQAWNPRTSPLREGDGADVIVLFNDTGKAPSAVKNLKGQVVFEGSKTLACQAHAGFDDKIRTRHIRVLLSGLIPELRFPLSRCNFKSVDQIDLVMATRHDLLQLKPADLLDLLKLVDKSALAILTTLPGSKIKSAMEDEGRFARTVVLDVQEGAREGYGLLLLREASKELCLVAPDRLAAHQQRLDSFLTIRRDELGGTLTIVPTDPNVAFIRAKRGQCGAIYASGAELKILRQAMLRDGIQHSFAPFWVTPSEIDAVQTALDAKTQAITRLQAEKDQQTKGEQILSAIKQQEASLTNQAIQSALQKQHGPAARAFENLLVDEMKKFLGSPSDYRALFQMKYPAITRWYEDALQDRWELVSVDVKLDDYGMVDYKRRRLDAAFATSKIKMKNRVLGEYKEHCFLTGFVLDKEFDMQRESIGVDCSNVSAVDKHKVGMSFVSRWLVR